MRGNGFSYSRHMPAPRDHIASESVDLKSIGHLRAEQRRDLKVPAKHHEKTRRLVEWVSLLNPEHYNCLFDCTKNKKW